MPANSVIRMVVNSLVSRIIPGCEPWGASNGGRVMRATRALIGAAAVLALAAGVMSMAAPAPPASSSFIVHEWGTFSSFSGSDGAALKFHPANSDLPAFVYRSKSLFAKDGYL